MRTFHELRKYLNELPLISEELHQSIHDVLDSEHIKPEHKLNHISHAIRGAIKRGEDHGLEDAKPKKGSSRAVFFPKEPHKLKIDGVDTHMPTALKVAFPGHLDKYRHHDESLLGEEQNRVEGDHYTNQAYGVIRHGDRHGEYHTNEHGFLAPMLHSHNEGHHIHFGKIEPIKAGEFQKHTVAPGFPKGISHQEMFDYLNHHHEEAHGKTYTGKTSKERIDKLDEHPILNNMHEWMGNTGAHPADLNKRNMGIWTHPVTGKKHVVVSDYGYTGDVARQYMQRRQRESKALRGW